MTTTPSSSWRRPATHVLSFNSPHPSISKPSISLDEWESKAALGELENTSVSAVKSALDRPSLSFKVGSRHNPSSSIAKCMNSSKFRAIASESQRPCLQPPTQPQPAFPVALPSPQPRSYSRTPTSTRIRPSKHQKNFTTGSPS